MYRFELIITIDDKQKKMRYQLKQYNTNRNISAKLDLIEALSIIRHEQLEKLNKIENKLTIKDGL